MQGERALDPGIRPVWGKFDDGAGNVHAHAPFLRSGKNFQPDLQHVWMSALGNDRWRGEFPVARIGEYVYTVAGAIDHFETWQSDLKKRVEAKQDLAVPFATGAALLEEAQTRATKGDGTKLAA